jgi:hypothetical protein
MVAGRVSATWAILHGGGLEEPRTDVLMVCRLYGLCNVAVEGGRVVGVVDWAAREDLAKFVVVKGGADAMMVVWLGRVRAIVVVVVAKVVALEGEGEGGVVGGCGRLCVRMVQGWPGVVLGVVLGRTTRRGGGRRCCGETKVEVGL